MTKTHVTRRRFLAEAGCLCGGVALTSQFEQSVMVAEKQKRPVWPITCVDRMLRHLGQEDCWAALQAVDAEGVEIGVMPDLTVPDLFHPTVKYSLATPEGIARVADDAKAADQWITAFCMHNRFEQRTEFEISWCTKVARIAQTLGVPTIRIDVVPDKLARPEFLELSVEALKKLVAATESTAVTFAVENHGNTTNDPEFLNALFAGVGSKRLGLTLDTANFYWFGHPLSKVYELYERFTPRTFHTHCKSIRYPRAEREIQRPMGWKYAEYQSPIDRGDIDFTCVAGILREAGYHNDLCVEDEFLGELPAGDATRRLAGEIEYLKRIRDSVTAA